MAGKGISGGTVHKVPSDLREALRSDRMALAAWEDLTPLARNEWICWAVSVKKPETRKGHIERMRAELKEGMRRPCCWPGCTHRTDTPVGRSTGASAAAAQRVRRPQRGRRKGGFPAGRAAGTGSG
jgi:hypothetical protein